MDDLNSGIKKIAVGESDVAAVNLRDVGYDIDAHCLQSFFVMFP